MICPGSTHQNIQASIMARISPTQQSPKIFELKYQFLKVIWSNLIYPYNKRKEKMIMIMIDDANYYV